MTASEPSIRIRPIRQRPKSTWRYSARRHGARRRHGIECTRRQRRIYAKVDLKPVNSTDVYDASLYVNRESRQALILVSNLPAAEGKAYVLQAVAPGSSEPTLLKRFHAEAGFGGVRIDTLPANLLLAAVTWQIASIDGTVLLTSS